MTFLSVENLHAGYNGHDVLRGISLQLAPGQNLGILGPNGSGKSTLLACVNGILTPAEGQILLDGRPVRSYPARELARHEATVSCMPKRPPFMTLRQYVLLGRYPWLAWNGCYSRNDRQYAEAALAACGICHLAEAGVSAVSAGEGQLAALARALAQTGGMANPLLLLDEISANLDLSRRMQISRLLATLLQKGCAILQAMHDCNLAALFCTHLLGIKNGSQLFYGSVADVFTEENISELYDWPVGIFNHPDRKIPQIYAHCLPVSGHISQPCGIRSQNLR